MPQARSDPSAPANGAIRVRGARVHNLQNLDVDIPRGRFVVLTGPSGSGKSSLAFDTLFAEGQRQYIESLSAYARQFLHQLERPDVDLIEGLPPTICIDQRPGNQNPRSTVATVTEIYDYLRLLYARLGQPACPHCQRPVEQQTVEQIQDQLMRLGEGARVMLLTPLVRGRRGSHEEVLARIRKAGFVRVRIDGRVYDLDEVPKLAPRKRHDIEAVVDRLVIRPGVRARLAESIQLAVQHGGGLVIACYLPPGAADALRRPQGWGETLFSTKFACPDCGIGFEELAPRTFSFNSPYGACPECDGLGVRIQFDPELVIPDRSLSLAQGAVAAWRGDRGGRQRKRQAALAPFLASKKADWDTPLNRLSPRAFQQLLRGDGRSFPGLLALLEKEWVTATRAARRQQLEALRGPVVCPACQGARLRPEAASVRVAGRAIHETTRMSVAEASGFFGRLEFPSAQQPVARPLLQEIRQRLQFLEHVGLDYLTLDRPADSLSGGELQRVRLATSLGAGLAGVCYILDEPSIGLHPRDNHRLIDALRRLQRRRSTVLVVEHDETVMRRADLILDIGPGPGRRGGRVVAFGSPEQVSRHGQSLTGRYLRRELAIPAPERRRRAAKTRTLVLGGVRTNNLKDIQAAFPLGLLICVTGVSGSGKSSLVNETLARALIRRLGGAAPKPGPFKSLRGASRVDKVIQIDQAPIGRTPRSNPATYTGVFDEIRKVFAGTRDARQRGFRVSRFSFNVKGGRCEACQGQGVRKIEMTFLPDLYVPCDQCGGARFNRHTLAVRYRGKTIADVLDMCVDEAAELFANFASIRRVLGCLQDVGLGYLALGQPSTTLSGGEAQRVKLAAQLARVDTGATLYLLDEPTTGLDFDDIRRLLEVLSRLVDRGNTVIVIEHHLDVIKSADWVIDLGPEGGDRGGRIVAEGPPERIAACPESHTGRFLREALQRRR